MKKYTKPELLKSIISADCDIAENVGLGGWLDQENIGAYEDTITTYEYNS